MKNSYITINKNSDNIEINAIINNQKLDKNVVKSDVEKILKLQKRIGKKKNIKVITDLNLDNLNITNNEELNLIASLKACQINNKDEKMEYIYMAACKYLDNEFRNNNVCEFCDDVCLAKRRIGQKNGCCYQFSDKFLGLPMLNNFKPCKYNENKACEADCLGCKLYCCDFVVKKGYKYTVFNVPLINYYFNLIQKVIIKLKVYTHKDEVLKLLKKFN